ncbi:hypothetical protein A0H81_00002 [Grifola frondosa]|uniref:Uncharacterized protein n=1 Tax=Grifola frondosa TaxID=5627 RepID=A0A1C7MPM4_GRIFR|nr:hypothetical protein A0H81_00002 [Grifola frondosa]
MSRTWEGRSTDVRRAANAVKEHEKEKEQRDRSFMGGLQPPSAPQTHAQNSLHPAQSTHTKSNSVKRKLELSRSHPALFSLLGRSVVPSCYTGIIAFCAHCSTLTISYEDKDLNFASASSFARTFDAAAQGARGAQAQLTRRFENTSANQPSSGRFAQRPRNGTGVCNECRTGKATP